MKRKAPPALAAIGTAIAVSAAIAGYLGWRMLATSPAASIARVETALPERRTAEPLQPRPEAQVRPVPPAPASAEVAHSVRFRRGPPVERPHPDLAAARAAYLAADIAEAERRYARPAPSLIRNDPAGRTGRINLLAAFGAPSDPDLAYNLAVSLDHLAEFGPARDQYARALQLAEGHRFGFDPARVRARLADLQERTAQ